MKTTIGHREEQQVPPFGRDDKGVLGGQNSWAQIFATAGAAVWAGIAVLARVGVARIGAIELMFLFGPLVIVPLGMELGRGMGGTGWFAEMARRLQPVGAGLAVGGIWMGPGKRAGGM